MKHLKLFKTAQDKEAWKNGENYITPNVIYINESDVIEYNPTSLSVLSLQTFTAYPEVANKIVTIFNKYCSNYENVSFMNIIIDANFNYEGINYVPGYAYITLSNPEDGTCEDVECKLSTEDLNYLQSISFIDTDGNVHKPHEMTINITISDISYEMYSIVFNIYKGNTNIDDFSDCIRYFEMNLGENLGFITDSAYPDPNAPSPV
jgi:hypothetical protein